MKALSIKRVFLFTICTIVFTVVIGSIAIAWYFSNQIIQSAHDEPVYPETVLGVRMVNDSAIVSLVYSKDAARPGRYGLFWPGGSAMLGRITKQTLKQIDRVIITGTQPTAGTKAGMSWTYGSDPQVALGFPFSTILIHTELGDAPAWYIPGTIDTWAISVHGSNADRRQPLQDAAVLHRAGLPILDITYRNDLGAPRSSDGLLHLGATEWRDVEAAVKTAINMGARHVILYGGSMGGAVVLQFLSHSDLAGHVSAVILDAPMLSVPQMMSYLATEHHIPAPVTWLAVKLTNIRIESDINQIDAIRFPPKIRPPVLILQGAADPIMPLTAVNAFLKKGREVGWQMQYAEFPHAGHNESWTTNSDRYEAIVSKFLEYIREHRTN